VAAIGMFYYERNFRTFALFDKEPDAKQHAARLEEQGFPKRRSSIVIQTDGTNRISRIYSPKMTT